MVNHYYISNNHKKAISQLLNLDTVTSYDLAQFQKVPFMIHLNGLKGGINHTYGGELTSCQRCLMCWESKTRIPFNLVNDFSPNRGIRPLHSETVISFRLDSAKSEARLVIIKVKMSRKI